MIRNKKSLLIKNRRRTAYYFTFGGIIAVFAVMSFIFVTSQQSHATIPAGGKQNEIGQVSYRFYSPSNSANPGAPLAGTNTQATLHRLAKDITTVVLSCQMIRLIVGERVLGERLALTQLPIRALRCLFTLTAT